MTDHVYRKFPDRVDTIRALKKTDCAFDEMCNDYEEMCTWLAVQGRPIDPQSKILADAREIIRDLEGEIIQKLEENQ